MNKRLEALRKSNEESNKITREALQQSLIYLMGNNNIDDITITEIVAKAGVSRAAFYRNYKTKQDILKDFSYSIAKGWYLSLQKKEYKHDHLLFLKSFFSVFKENKYIVKLLMKANLLDVFDYVKYTHFSCYTYEEKYKLRALQSGLYEIIKEWTKRDFEESPAEMAKICLETFPQLDLLFKYNK